MPYILERDTEDGGRQEFAVYPDGAVYRRTMEAVVEVGTTLPTASEPTWAATGGYRRVRGPEAQLVFREVVEMIERDVAEKEARLERAARTAERARRALDHGISPKAVR